MSEDKLKVLIVDGLLEQEPLNRALEDFPEVNARTSIELNRINSDWNQYDLVVAHIGCAVGVLEKLMERAESKPSGLVFTHHTCRLASKRFSLNGKREFDVLFPQDFDYHYEDDTRPYINEILNYIKGFPKK
jgi:hypothetical protein